MSNPFKALEELVTIGGRTMKKSDLVEFEIEKRLKSADSMADIQKALSKQGINVPNDYVKQRMAVARRRDPGLKTDPRMRRMEANWIIEKGQQTGKPWEDIAAELRDAGFNGDKLVGAAQDKMAKSAYSSYGVGLYQAPPSDLVPSLNKLPWVQAMKSSGFTDTDTALAQQWMKDRFQGKSLDETAKSFGMSVEDMMAKGADLQKRIDEKELGINLQNHSIPESMRPKRKAGSAATGAGLMAVAGITAEADAQTKDWKFPPALAPQHDRNNPKDAPVTDAERAQWAEEDKHWREMEQRKKAQFAMAQAEAEARRKELDEITTRMATIVGSPTRKRVGLVDEDAVIEKTKQKKLENPVEKPNPLPGDVAVAE